MQTKLKIEVWLRRVSLSLKHSVFQWYDDHLNSISYFFLISIFVKSKYGTVQELRSTFSHTKSINIDFSLVLSDLDL